MYIAAQIQPWESRMTTISLHKADSCSRSISDHLFKDFSCASLSLIKKVAIVAFHIFTCFIPLIYNRFFSSNNQVAPPPPVNTPKLSLVGLMGKEHESIKDPEVIDKRQFPTISLFLEEKAKTWKSIEEAIKIDRLLDVMAEGAKMGSLISHKIFSSVFGLVQESFTPEKNPLFFNSIYTALLKKPTELQEFKKEIPEKTPLRELTSDEIKPLQAKWKKLQQELKNEYLIPHQKYLQRTFSLFFAALKKPNIHEFASSGQKLPAECKKELTDLNLDAEIPVSSSSSKAEPSYWDQIRNKIACACIQFELNEDYANEKDSLRSISAEIESYIFNEFSQKSPEFKQKYIKYREQIEAYINDNSLVITDQRKQLMANIKKRAEELVNDDQCVEHNYFRAAGNHGGALTRAGGVKKWDMFPKPDDV